MKRTFIFTDLDYVGHMYRNIVKVEKCITANQVQSAMGLVGEDNIGKYVHCAVQAAPSFSSSFPAVLPQGPDTRGMHCLIPCAIDQDPFFRITRDVAPRLKLHKPAVIHSKFFPGLSGLKEKMSASQAMNTIYLTDSAKDIQGKISQAFSGGKASLEEQRKYGADLEVDVSIQYLRFLLEDDERLKRIESDYACGKMLTGEVKLVLIELLQKLTAEHQKRRAAVTDDMVREFMRVRRLEHSACMSDMLLVVIH